MDAFEVNKTIGAVLSALLVVFGSKTMLDIVYKEHKPEKPSPKDAPRKPRPELVPKTGSKKSSESTKPRRRNTRPGCRPKASPAVDPGRTLRGYRGTR